MATISTPWDDLLIHTANVWKFAPTQDADAGVGSQGYTESLGSAVPCYAEFENASRSFDQTQRVVLIDDLTVFFASNLGFSLNDRIDWTDGLAQNHQFFVTGVIDMTPQGGLCEVSVTERL